ncbi:MAG: c-type cytochrome, partial [Verrucomicrobiaceae bacterium]|nr:c-type cytochrome [Verrucomicrobiaceae bacterium]
QKAVADYTAADSVALVEAAGVLESLGAVDADLLDRLEASDEARVRAVAARILARSADPVADASERLARLLADPHPRPRLEAVVACANRPAADSLRLALTALDADPDRFVEYSLAQAVFALEDHWLPALRKGDTEFEKPTHLAFVLETYGGEVSADLARKTLAGPLTPVDRGRLLAVLARVGNAADLGMVFAEAVQSEDAELIVALAESAETRRMIPATAFATDLRTLLSSASSELRRVAFRLAGLWKAAPLAKEAEEVTRDAAAPAALRVAAMGALARLDREAAVSALRPLVREGDTPMALRRPALEALAVADLPGTATALAGMITDAEQKEKGFSLLPILLRANGGPSALAAALESGTAPDAVTAQEILAAMNRLGRRDGKLTPLLNQMIGRQSGAPEYDPARVAAVVTAIREGKGDAKRGAEVYHMAQLACTACHQIGDEGGVIGPSLNGVGAGMPLDQIVESILWPDRQIKEGFQAVALTTKTGSVISGYIEREGDDIVWYRDAATPWIKPLASKDIASREAIPTLMPPQLTDSLTDEQFLDLVAYLASLKG